MRSFHAPCVCYWVLGISMISGPAFASDIPSPKISKETRAEIIHGFNEELVYIRASFPMGKTGLKLKDGTLSPSGQELKHLMALWGPAAKPGDRARISDVIIKENYIDPTIVDPVWDIPKPEEKPKK